MKSHEISRSKIGPFSLACTDPYIGIGWENQSSSVRSENSFIQDNCSVSPGKPRDAKKLSSCWIF